MFSVGTEKGAKMLLTLACEMNRDGEYIARELAFDQSLDSLESFGDRLQVYHDIAKKKGLCECKERNPNH